jgi:F0F1-type ATP synthase assembly protein I
MSSEKPYKSYVKYSGIAFQMIAIIVIGALLGKFLDKTFDTGVILTAAVTLMAVALSLYVSLKDFIK